jgi:hypothetical protein
MSITALPTPPSRQDPANFSDRADAFLGALPTFATEANALASDVNADEIAAAASASTASAAALSAANSEANAASLANFKGLWSAQTGALNKPASVDHNGAFWGLLNNLADVTTSEPGVSSDWVVISGAWPIIRINTNTTAVPRRTYYIYGACTLTAPAITGNRKQFAIDVPPGVSGAIFAPAGSDKTRGASGSQTIDAPFKITLTDSGATDGWI